MRSYGQVCAIAKALDVVGDRWTLLIVREVSLRPCRYSDLKEALPGIATNLLAQRLRELEAAGVLVRQEPVPPVATATYVLTPRGEGLIPVVDELAWWGAPLLLADPALGRGSGYLLGAALRSILRHAPAGTLAPCRIIVTGDGVTVTVDRSTDGAVRAEAGDHGPADLRIRGSVEAIFAELRGEARRRSRPLAIEGDERILVELGTVAARALDGPGPARAARGQAPAAPS